MSVLKLQTLRPQSSQVNPIKVWSITSSSSQCC
jgi:hypothetical protein